MKTTIGVNFNARTLPELHMCVCVSRSTKIKLWRQVESQFLRKHYLPLLFNASERSENNLCNHAFNIWLVDLYNYIPKPLLALPAIFIIENIANEYFVHLFNQPKFHNYVCLIPDLECYDVNLKSTEKRQKLIDWHWNVMFQEVFVDFN